MSHSPRGFTGTVGQAEEAVRFAMAAGRFRVASTADWAVTIAAGVDRTVNIAAGTAQACGVTDVTNAIAPVQFATNAGGATRLDALIARWDWSAMTVTFMPLLGTTVPPLINTTTTPNAAKINRIPGVMYDALLGIQSVAVGVGAFPAGSFVDLRPTGVDGMVLPNLAYLSLIDAAPGTRMVSPAAPVDWVKVSSWPDAATDGTAVPAGSWVGRLRCSRVVSVINAGGGINVPFNVGIPFTKLISAQMTAGDAAASLAIVIPIVANHTGSSAGGAAYMANGSPVLPPGQVRVDLDVLAYVG